MGHRNYKIDCSDKKNTGMPDKDIPAFRNINLSMYCYC